MDELDVGILSAKRLAVADLYADLVRVRTQEAEQTLSSCSGTVALTQGAACLSEAVAHLHDAAHRFLSPEGGRHQHLERLADALLAEAAAFEQSADLLASADNAGAT